MGIKVFIIAMAVALLDERAALSAASETDLQKTVEGLLMGYEPADPGPALRRLGAPAAEVLLQIVQDQVVPPLRRLRALEALGHVPTPAGLAHVRTVIAQRRAAREGLAVYELAAAVRALGGFGPPVVPEILPLLTNESADVREAAASSLAKLRTREALRALQRRLTVEPDSGVRFVLQRALGR